jgi:sugar phosphate isomerase/epimerase
MWAAHPDNGSAQAWRDMRTELDLLLAAAEEADVLLAIEPEPGNVVRDADAAVRLYAELADDAARVGIIADAANLLAGRAPATHARILEHAFDALAERIVCLHAKDLVTWERSLAGQGVVDYGHVASLYARHGLRAPVIVQDVTPGQASAALDYVRERFAQGETPPAPGRGSGSVRAFGP